MKILKVLKNEIVDVIADKRGKCDFEPTDRMIELDVERIREIIPDVPEEEWDDVIVKACEYYHEYLQRKKPANANRHICKGGKLWIKLKWVKIPQWFSAR